MPAARHIHFPFAASVCFGVLLSAIYLASRSPRALPTLSCVYFLVITGALIQALESKTVHTRIDIDGCRPRWTVCASSSGNGNGNGNRSGVVTVTVTVLAMVPPVSTGSAWRGRATSDYAWRCFWWRICRWKTAPGSTETAPRFTRWRGSSWHSPQPPLSRQRDPLLCLNLVPNGDCRWSSCDVCA